MNIKFYYNSSDNRCIKKNILNEFTITGNLRAETSIIKPKIVVSNSSVVRYNYAYIPEFRRYYYIVNVVSIRNGLWEVELQVDPLMSFKADILDLEVVVNKQEQISNGDEYIDDSSLVTTSKTYNSIYSFSKGFNDTGEFILITAG